MIPLSKPFALLAGLAGLFAAGPASAAIDWSKVPGKDVVLYYPGQANWEWALSTQSRRDARRPVCPLRHGVRVERQDLPELP